MSVPFSFNPQQHTPQYGGGNSGLPVGKHKVVIVKAELVPVMKTEFGVEKQVGGYLAFDLTPIEGPLAGKGLVQTDRLNLFHAKPNVVEIANKQLSAYCSVIGQFQAFNDASVMYNKPFIVEIGYQKGQEPTAEKPEGGYTEVKNVFDVNGNEPGKAGAGPQTAAPAHHMPPAQQPMVAPSSGWPGSSPQQQPQQQPQGAPGGYPIDNGPQGAPNGWPTQAGPETQGNGAPAGWPTQPQQPSQGQAWGGPPANGAPAGWGSR